jgi:hypothetical protein
MENFDSFVKKLLLDENIPKEIILNIILVYYNARFATLIEYTNFSIYYEKNEFYIFLCDILSKINMLEGNVLCITIETDSGYPRYLIFAYANVILVDHIIKANTEWSCKIGTLLEMTKPGGNFDDITKRRIYGRVIVKKFPGIDLFAETFEFSNNTDIILMKKTLLFRLSKYNYVLAKFGYECITEFGISQPIKKMDIKNILN